MIRSDGKANHGFLTSFDSRLFAVFFLCSAAVTFLPPSPSPGGSAWIIGALAAILSALIGVSVIHRRKHGWKRQGVRASRAAVGILLSLWLGAVSVLPLVTLIPRLEPFVIGFSGCVFAIVSMGILESLNLLDPARSTASLRASTDPNSPREVPLRSDQMASVYLKPCWHRTIRRCLVLWFMLAISSGAAYHTYLNLETQAKSPDPVSGRTELLKDKVRTVYVTPTEKLSLSILYRIHTWGLLAGLVIGLGFRFGLGVKLERGESDPKP